MKISLSRFNKDVRIDYLDERLTGRGHVMRLFIMHFIELFMLMCFYCVFIVFMLQFYCAFLLQPCLRALFPFRANKSWWCELRIIKHFKNVQSVHDKSYQHKQDFKEPQTACVFSFHLQHKVCKNSFPTQQSPRVQKQDHSFVRRAGLKEDAIGAHWFSPHVKKLLLTWHFLTRGKVTAEERREGET